MPAKSITYELDNLRFAALVERCEMADNLWTAFRLACERGDTDIAKHHAKQLAVLTKAAIALVNRLGQAEPDDARQ
jgi:hypothetical protein